jgi:SAM-dependent methyltransferase
MNETFETSYGDKIALMPGVEKILYPYSNDEEHYRDQLENGYASPRFLHKKVKSRITNIGTDLDSYTLVIDFLEELNLLSGQYERALDIAGAPGIHGALLRGNYARYVDVADVRDGTDPQLTRKLKRALWKYRLQKIEDRLFKGGLLRHRVKRVQHLEHLNTPSFKNYYNFNFRRKPDVDRFIVGDWRETVTQQYDFIMSFMSFWLWDHKQAIPKVASSLNPGGIFVTLAPYCWAGRGLGGVGSLLGGAFPFFEQRLTLTDMKRYYEQFKPNLAQHVEEVYRFFDPHRPSINQYVECALENGLVVRGTKRLYYNYKKLALTYEEFFGATVVVNSGLQDAIVADAGEVLRNIGRFRNDITFEDLLTKGVILVFQKPS